MTRVIQDQITQAQIRKLPIAASLESLLDAAALAAGIDAVIVFSGGQAAIGTSGPRTGSTRHDLGYAADLQLRKDGRILNFTVPAERTQIAAFVAACASRGATGIGAAVDYMGPTKLHVGFGGKSIWGAGGKAANAPGWLIEAVQAGWAHPVTALPVLRKGDQGDAVMLLQRALWAEGFECGLVDGDFGALTEAAVKKAQAASGLVVDGVCGAKTWAALKAAA